MEGAVPGALPGVLPATMQLMQQPVQQSTMGEMLNAPLGPVDEQPALAIGAPVAGVPSPGVGQLTGQLPGQLAGQLPLPVQVTAPLAGPPSLPDKPQQLLVQPEFPPGVAYVPEVAAAAPAVPEELPGYTKPTMKEKQCTRCNLVKQAAEFYQNRFHTSGLSSHCKQCDTQLKREKAAQKAQVLVPTVAQKVCGKCSEEKAASEFYRNKYEADGLHKRCKDCYNSALKTKLRRATGELDPAPVTQKLCKSCGITKAATDFYKSPSGADGLMSICRACRLKQMKDKREEMAREGGDRPGRKVVLEPTVEHKICRKCGVDKPSSEFFRDKYRPTGMETVCKDCSSHRRRRKVAALALQVLAESDKMPPVAASGGKRRRRRSRI